MKNQTVYVLEQNGIKAIYMDIESLKEAIDLEFDGLPIEDFESTEFTVYVKTMTEKEIDDLPEFDGF